METVNVIKCPHCKTMIEPWEYIDTGDMEGNFSMTCEECGREFNVSFTTDIKFTTTHNSDKKDINE